ncbi:MAG: B-box zinc finger protein [Desulfotalea sp.]
MSIPCTFHRSAAAHFQCHECGSAFCENCITPRETRGYAGKDVDYFCPGCNIPAELIGLGNVIEPFWQRLTSIFLYPFQLTPLILTLLLAILGTIFSGSVLVSLFVWVVMMKYAYVALTTTAQGSLKAPVVSAELINKDVLQVFKQFVVLLGIGIVVLFISAYTGSIGLVACIVFVALALPAIIMILVASNSILQAINPITSFGIMTRIGWPYFLMYLFLVFLNGAPAVIFAYLPNILPPSLTIFLQLFFQQMYAIITYHFMGYFLLQYHYELGYTVDYEFFMENRGGKQKRVKLTPKQVLMNGVAVLIKTAKYQEAIELMKPHIIGEDVDIELSEKFLQILKMAGENEKVAMYSIRHLEYLVLKEKKRKATVLFLEISKTGFERLLEAESVYKIGSWFEDRNNYKQAMATYGYFLKNYKKNEFQPVVYLSLAKLLNEQANNGKKAKQILMAIVKHYPSHPVAIQAKDYLGRAMV